MRHVQAMLEEARSHFVFSGYQLAGVWGEEEFSFSGGITSYWPEGTPVGDSTFFDIGSVTKVVATTSIVARGLERKTLSLEEPVSTYLPELKGTGPGAIAISDLLSHSAGLRWWFPLYQKTPENLLEWFRKEEKSLCEARPGSRAVYSDVGFLLLGLVLERVGGKLSDQFRKEVAEPLKLTQTKYGPVSPKESVATEFCRWRKRVVHGEVFDENAASLGGTCSHAGLFSTAKDLVRWARGWLDPNWISAETIQRFTRPTLRVAGSTWALGWDTKSPSGSSAGNLLSARSFGHLGYPGCSVWIDPDAHAIVVFLSNRIHPSRVDERIRVLRPKLHDAIALNFSRPA